MVKVAPSSWRHYYFMFCLGCMYATLFTSPAHYCCIGCKATFQYFIPANYFSSFAIYKFFHPLYKIALQFIFILQAFCPHELLACTIFFPPYFAAFITANMYHFAREQFYHFCQYIFQKFESGFSGSKHIVFYTIQPPSHGNFCFNAWVGTQFWIGSQCSHAMARHFNFWQNRNEPVCCILNDFFYLFLCVKSSMTHTVIAFARETPNDGSISPTPNRSQFWIFFYFNSPPLIIC